MPANSFQTVLRQRVRQEVPTRPGVYTWLGPGGEVLYVGKSSNLRRRMLSYLSPGRVDTRSRTRHLAFSLRDFRYRETLGELLALLLEDALIKQLQPRHNERGRDFRERRYLLLRERPNPGLQVVEADAVSDGVLYGPFKDEHFVVDLIAFVIETFTAGATSTGSALTNRHIAGIRQFLEGDVAPAAARLTEAVQQASDQLRFERAAALRDRLAFCLRYGEREQFLRDFTSGTLAMYEQGSGLAYQFRMGALAAVTNHTGPIAVPDELRTTPRDVRWLRDRGNIVHDWARKQRRSGPAGGTR